MLYIWAESTPGRMCSKWLRLGVTAMPPLTSEPPPTPRPWYTLIPENFSASRMPM